MPVHYKKVGETLVLSGQTFPYKEAIKSIGARFNAVEKNWWLQDSEESRLAVDKLVRSTGGICLDETSPQISQPNEPTQTLDMSPVEAAMQKASELNTQPEPSDRLVETQDAYTVSSLLVRLERAIRSQFPDSIWIIGELQNISFKGQAIYFRLAESQNGENMATAEVSASIWSTALQRLKRKIGEDVAAWLTEGLEVRLHCQVNFYRERAQVSLQVLDIDPEFSLGKLALKRQATVKSLKQRGLFQKNRQLVMPKFPLRIGLITADGSRAKSDFLNQLEMGGYSGTVVFCAATMQGKNTSQEVVSAIQSLQQARVDIIVLTRGGGSQSDLRWFDAEDIALAICHAKVPLITAIGHHDDISIAEEVSHMPVKTPTAAAEVLLAMMQDRRIDIQNLLRNLQSSLEAQITKRATLNLQLENRLLVSTTNFLQRKLSIAQNIGLNLLQGSSEAIYRVRRSLDQRFQTIYNSAMQAFQQHAQRRLAFAAKIQASDPRPWMQRGWTQLEFEGKTIKSITAVKTGDHLKSRLPDGLLNLSVTELSPRDKS